MAFGAGHRLLARSPHLIGDPVQNFFYSDFTGGTSASVPAVLPALQVDRSFTSGDESLDVPGKP